MEIKSDFNSSYFVIKPNSYSVQDYRIRMLLQNDLQGLLKLSCRCIDNKGEYLYEVGQKQQLTAYLNNCRVDYSFLFQLLKSLSAVASELGSYLLDIRHIVLSLDYIFLDEQKEKFYFCYYPENQEPVHSAFHNMSKSILDRLDENDEKACTLANELFIRSRNSSFSIDSIIDLAVRRYYKNKSMTNGLNEAMARINSRLYESEAETEIYDEKEEKKSGFGIVSIRKWLGSINDRILNK